MVLLSARSVLALGHENKHSQPCFLCLCSLIFVDLVCIWGQGVRWFRSSVGPADMGLSGWGYSAKALPASEGPRRAAPEVRACFTSQPCATDQPAGTWPGEIALPIPALGGPGVLCCHAPRHLSWGQQDQVWGWGHARASACRALNDRSYSQVQDGSPQPQPQLHPRNPGLVRGVGLMGKEAGNLRGMGVGPSKLPRLPLSCGVLGTPMGAIFLALARPYHPQSHRPPHPGLWTLHLLALCHRTRPAQC